MPELPPDVDETIRLALEEDVGSGDVTTSSVVPPDAEARAEFVAKGAGVLCGLDVADRAFAMVPGARVGIAWRRRDGDPVATADRFGEIRGSARTILTGERVALNFLTHLSGVATFTRRFVDACAGTESMIL
jgi:nicotinate-nucleotide pyrophosphorylase (carboxylating)